MESNKEEKFTEFCDMFEDKTGKKIDKDIEMILYLFYLKGVSDGKK